MPVSTRPSWTPRCGSRCRSGSAATGSMAAGRSETDTERCCAACPTKSVAAQSIEDSVVSRMRALGADPRIVLETARKVRERVEASSGELAVELKVAQKDLTRLQGELVKAVATPGNGLRTDRMADLQEQIRAAERRAGEVRAELDALAAETVDEEDLRTALQSFDPVWQSLNTAEQTRLIRAVIDRIGYDGRTGRIAVTFRAAGFKAICAAAGQDAAGQAAAGQEAGV